MGVRDKTALWLSGGRHLECKNGDTPIQTAHGNYSAVSDFTAEYILFNSIESMTGNTFWLKFEARFFLTHSHVHRPALHPSDKAQATWIKHGNRKHNRMLGLTESDLFLWWIPEPRTCCNTLMISSSCGQWKSDYSKTSLTNKAN